MINNLDELRKQIDSLDEKLVEILAERMRVSKQIGEIKKQNNLPILDIERWQNILEGIIQKAKKLQLPEDLIKNIFTTIHEHSLKMQKEK